MNIPLWLISLQFRSTDQEGCFNIPAQELRGALTIQNMREAIMNTPVWCNVCGSSFVLWHALSFGKVDYLYDVITK